MTPVFEQEYARGRQRYPQPEPQFKLGGDEIGISHKGTWPVVITVKERDEKGRVVPKEVLRVSTGEHNNFWCSMFIVTRADGTAPIPPVVIHQAKERTVAHLHAIPSDWLVLTSPSSPPNTRLAGRKFESSLGPLRTPEEGKGREKTNPS